MTAEEAHNIMAQLQELEFPYAMNKARRIALFKAGGIPATSKLFAATGQNTLRTAGRRAVDTEILLREAQSQPRDSERYMQAVARMSYLHARCRKAGKILDEDLLHTLGSGAELDHSMRKSLSLEAPGPMLTLCITLAGHTRRFIVRHLCLPRPSCRAFKAVADTSNPKTGLYNFDHVSFQPWYVKPTFWARWRPSILLVEVLGGRAPGTGGDKYHPQGYSLKTIGPVPQEGRGLEEMGAIVEFLKARGSPKCLFSQGSKQH